MISICAPYEFRPGPGRLFSNMPGPAVKLGRGAHEVREGVPGDATQFNAARHLGVAEV